MVEARVELLWEEQDLRWNRSASRMYYSAAKIVGIDFLTFLATASLLFLTVFMVGCGVGSGTTPPPNQGAAPANLTYPQTTISATVGVPISVDTPTVTGTVTSYGVSPGLPSGLSLNSSNGAISGTPTTQSATAVYRITASNSAGSVATSVQITVSIPVISLSNLVYPQASLSLEIGQPFPTDIPSVSGTVATYSISPPLPAGLNLDANTGALYGIPSASSSSNTYTVTASNASGKTTATLPLTVTPALVALLDLGSANSITKIVSLGANVLVQDQSGHWVLIDYSSGTELAAGEAGPYSCLNPVASETFCPIDMAGSILVVGVTNGLEVRSAADGHLLSIISFPLSGQTQSAWWNLASDGSYICVGSSAGLAVWSSSGAALLSRAGDYSNANVFAAPGQILVAQGPAGANVIETVSVPSGTSSVGPVFSGTFAKWFTDGNCYLTYLGNNVWTYDTTSTQKSLVNLPTFTAIGGGVGNWIWTQSSGPNPNVKVYPQGSSTAAGSYAISVEDMAIQYGKTIGLLSSGATTVGVVDLSGSSPVETNYTVPTAYNKAYAAFSASQWLVGNLHGSVVDGASLSSKPRFLTQGTAFDVAGSTSSVAVAVANGNIYLFDPTRTTPQQTINFASSQVALSSDGTVLAASYEGEDAQYLPNESLNAYALPAGTLINSWPYQFGGTYLFAFSLASSGSNIGQATGTFNGSTWHYVRQVTAVSGGSPIWSDTPSFTLGTNPIPPPLFSPDGTLIAAASGTRSPTSVTTIYHNGTVIGAVPGFAVGWIDDSHLLVDTYAQNSRGVSYYSGCDIYSPTGALISSPPLPEINSFQTVSSGLIYTPDSNTIYSTSTGASTWASSYSYGGVGATAGGDVVFLSGARVVVQSQ